MGLVSRFEDLKAWRQARKLTVQAYDIARSSNLKRDFGLSDQLRRAAVSTMNNIAEGFDSSSRTEFRRFLRYAARSASEVQSCLYVALDQKYIDRPSFLALYSQAQTVRQLCSGLSRRLGSYKRVGNAKNTEVREESAQWENQRAHGLTGSRAHGVAL